MIDVLDAPGGKIVDDDDLVARRQEGLGEMRSNESGSARDESSTGLGRTL